MIEPKKPKIGVVVGSGGIKTLGVTALFELLDAYQVKPDLVIGCSGGSVLSSQWASGRTIQELKDFTEEYKKFIKNISLLNKIDFQTLFRLNNYPGSNTNPTGILKYEWVTDFLIQQLGMRRLEENKIKTLIMTTDLKTGNPVLLSEGLLAECIYASCALYPLASPICIKNKWLVDGAYHSAIPIFEASKQHCDKIIAISFNEKTPNTHGSFLSFYLEFVSRVLNENARKQNSFTVHFHHEEIVFINCYYDRNLNFWDVDHLDYINEITKLAVEKKKDEILECFNITPASPQK